MRTVNTREIQKRTKAVRERLLAGETLGWVVGRQVIGYLTPAAATGDPAPWPDLMGRLRGIHGAEAADGRRMREEPAARLIDDDRG